MRWARTRDGLLAVVPLSIVMSRWSGIALSESRADLPRTTMLMPAHLRGEKQGDARKSAGNRGGAGTSVEKKRETGKRASFIIPSGNMGNSIACFWAREMGCPIDRIYLATNANKTVPNYYETLTYQPQLSIRTLANAMDVGAPNNLERLLSLYKGKESSLKKKKHRRLS